VRRGRSWPRFVLALLGTVLACNPNSTRPPQLEPVTGAVRVELALPRDLATQELADQLVVDTIPVSVVQQEDGYLETPWFDAATGTPTDDRRLGPDVVRLRAWIDPGAPRHSYLTVELVYRPLADPSRSQRQLDHQVPNDHPAAERLGRALEALTSRYPSHTSQ
jgi:hypothetical protein